MRKVTQAILFLAAFVFLALPHSSSAQFVSDTNTVALFHFDESMGDTCFDSSANGFNGKALGATIVPGTLSNARRVNGGSDRIEIPAFNPEGPFTIEANVKIDPPSGGEQVHPIIGHGVYDFGKRGYLLWVNTNQDGESSVVFWANSSDGNTTIFLADTRDASPSRYFSGFDEWHHIAGVWDGHIAKVFVDGVLWHQVTGDSTTSIGSNAFPTLIGCDYFPTGNISLKGTIDEVRISNTAREYHDLDTYAFYRFEEAAGDSVYDSSGNDHHGAATGASILSGVLGNARRFNGGTDKIEVPAFNPGLNAFALEADVKIDLPSGGEQVHPIIGHGVYDFDKRGYLLWVSTAADGTSSVVFWANSQDGNTTVFLANTREASPPRYYTGFNEWHHMAGVWDRHTAKIYVDGELWLQVAGDSTTPVGSNDYPTLIGCDYFPTGTISLQGTVDQVRFSLREGPTGVEMQDKNSVVSQYRLYQNYPNPFNPTTTIRYSLPHRSRVTLVIFDPLGQEVATLVNDNVEAGSHAVLFDASRFASGVYFCRIQAGSFVQTLKLCLVR